ncbi:NAD+ synthase [bacterium]|nr:NAD+ synthase [bacterium]
MTLRFGLAQLNPVVGDIRRNAQLLIDTLPQFAANRADIVITSELFLMGYSPKDMMTYPWIEPILDDAINHIKEASKKYSFGIIVGAPGPRRGRRWLNSAYLIDNGELIHRWDKQLLPFYDVFDDPRYFASGGPASVIEWRGHRIAAIICEDAWADMYPEDYGANPIDQLAVQNPDYVFIPTASPFEVEKTRRRTNVLSAIAKKMKTTVVMVNQIGGQDDVVYAGSSCVIGPAGQLFHQVPDFFEGPVTAAAGHRVELKLPIREEQIRLALTTGLRDYVRKSGFNSVLIGLSGGIDSAVAAVLATEAVGAYRVHGVSLPSRYTSKMSTEDARELAKNLGIGFTEIPIENMYRASLASMALAAEPVTTAMENLQSRIRGTILMTIANTENRLVITTGNKSELAMGYCTLYGDMNGAFAPLADLYKTDVYALASYLNTTSKRIPQRTIDRAPSAELRPDQTDQDSLPPYIQLDAILQMLVEEKRSRDDVIEKGFPSDLVDRIVVALYRNEYKRFQAAPGVKLGKSAFGVGRRIPFAGGWPS